VSEDENLKELDMPVRHDQHFMQQQCRLIRQYRKSILRSGTMITLETAAVRWVRHGLSEKLGGPIKKKDK
jgi:hypothetical protein